jgi:Raf kinase inhibitor-like YbhB/YbcL family protein
VKSGANPTGTERRLPRTLLFAAVLALGLLPASWATEQNLDYGKLLYQNHCLGCHESSVRIRSNRKAESLGEVRIQVARWAKAEQLPWGREEIAAVSAYLFLRYYQKTAHKGGDKMALSISSPAFSHNGEIPARFTCDGEDIPPRLSWSGLPRNTRSLALIVDDPDAPDPAAPKMTWVHWVLYNLPPDSDGLPEGISDSNLPAGARQGLNDWKRTRFGGPCPPIGRHRYFFKLYALDQVLPDLRQPSKSQLERAMQGHILDQTELIGTYQRGN